MPNVTIVHDGHKDSLESLRTDLMSRGWIVRMDGFASSFFDDGYNSAGVSSAPLIAMMPEDKDKASPCLQKLDRFLASGIDVILVVPDKFELPPEYYSSGLRHVVHERGLGYDRLFEEIYRALLGPLPAWLDLRMRPSQIHRPTGVAWWTEDVYVADEEYEHVVRIGLQNSNVVLPGLTEPHHIHLDRRLLSVANKSADQVLMCDIDDGMATNIRSYTEINGMPLRRPHDMKCAQYIMALADTDNQRVVISDASNMEKARWRELSPMLPFRAPCGVFISPSDIWVADTFNHRFVRFDHGGNELQVFGSYGDGDYQFQFPVAIQRWKNYVFVSDEENERLQVFRCDVQEQNPKLLTFGYLGRLAPGVIQQPFGLSVNHENRLAVADRKQKCIWVVDLGPALQHLADKSEFPEHIDSGGQVT